VKKSKSVEVVASAMSFNEMRSVLSDEARKLRSGKPTAKNALAISNLIGANIRSVKIELELCRFLGKIPRVTGVLPENLDTTTQPNR